MDIMFNEELHFYFHYVSYHVSFLIIPITDSTFPILSDASGMNLVSD